MLVSSLLCVSYLISQVFAHGALCNGRRAVRAAVCVSGCRDVLSWQTAEVTIC
jgi:hypothetical protein